MGHGIGRMDLKVDESDVAACVFSRTELLFIRFNGNRVCPRLEAFVEAQADKRITERRDTIGKIFVNNWVKDNLPGTEIPFPNNSN